MISLYGPSLPDRSGLVDDDVFSTPFVMFDPATGEILQDGRMTPSAIRRLEADGVGSFLMQAGSFAGHYVDLAAGAVRPKTACPAELDGLVLTGLPVPCTVEVSNPTYAPSSYAWSDDELELSFGQPGTYRVRVLSVPHLPGEFEVTA